MKTLLLMRHAKSSWKDPKLADHERPLNKRGQKDAPFMGEVLLEKELLPQKILASSAVRVRETVAGLVKGSGYGGEIEYMDALYLSEPETYLAALRSLPDSIERVMVIGHNPGLEGLLQQLSGRIESIGTGSIAYLSMPIQNWSELTGETEGELIELLRLHDLRDEKEEIKKKDEKKHKGNKKKEDEKKRKEEKAAVQKKDKEEKAAVTKQRKEEKEATKKQQKEEKVAGQMKLKEEKAAATIQRKEEKVAAAKKKKEEKLENEKIHKEEKPGEPRKHKK